MGLWTFIRYAINGLTYDMASCMNFYPNEAMRGTLRCICRGLESVQVKHKTVLDLGISSPSAASIIIQPFIV